MDLDLESSEYRSNPWATYAHFRDHDPVYWSSRYRSFFLFKYEDIRHALEDGEFLVSYPFRATRQALGASLLDIDGADHRRMREAIAPRFKRRRTAEFEPVLRDIIRGVIDSCADTAEIDFIARIAYEVPLRVILWLLGGDQADARRLFHELRPIVAYIDDPQASLARADEAREAIYRYGLDLLGRSSSTADTVTGDLMKAIGLGRLDDDEAARLIVMLIAAATETTAASLGNLMACVLSDPGLVAELAGKKHAVRATVNEALRWAPPLHTTLRLTACEMRLGDVVVPAGSAMQLVLASANRDPEVFENGERWNPWRAAGRPVMSFGAGSHHCMGFNLAMAELCIFLEEFLVRFPHCYLKGPFEVSGRTFWLPRSLHVRLQVA